MFFEKGTALPARVTKNHRSAYAIHKVNKDEKLRIPIVEGENLKRADRNDLLGALEVSAENLSRDIPAGADGESGGSGSGNRWPRPDPTGDRRR